MRGKLWIVAAAIVAAADARAQWLPQNATSGPIYYNGGNLGLGTSAPICPIDVQHNGNGPIMNTAFGTAIAGQFSGRSARGTQAAPSQTLAGDYLAVFSGRGYEGMTPGFTGSTGRITFIAAEGFTTTAQGTIMTLETTGLGTVGYVERVRITPEGNVGIGTSSPQARLDVSGSANVSGNLTVTGDITGLHVFHAVFQDVAEWVPASSALEAGTVVVLDRAASNRVTPSQAAYDTSVAGVVSASPGIVLGQAGPDKEQVATMGRVLVKVDASRSPVDIGDLLVTSGVPGVAMKSIPIDVGGTKIHRPGTIIGKALQPLSAGTGQILVLLSLQ